MEIVYIDPNISLPKRGRSDNAGLYFYSTLHIVLNPREIKIVDLGMKIAFPSNICGLLKEISIIVCKGIFVLGSVINQDYRGEVMVILPNINN